MKVKSEQPIIQTDNASSSSSSTSFWPQTSSAAATATPSFSSQFCAANLFGLLENRLEFELQNKIDETPTTNTTINSSSSLTPTSTTTTATTTTTGNNNINNNNAQTQQSFSGLSLAAATTPIDQLLQISQQILNDANNIAKQQQQMPPSTQQQQIDNAARNRSSGLTNNKKSVEDGEGGTTKESTNERKRSYPYTFQFCVLCQKNVHSSKLPCHIRQCHVGKPMFQCPVCDFTSTYSKNNVKSHMVSLHGLAGDPISYMDQYAVQVEDFMKKCFPNVRGRGRPVHGGQFPPAKQQLLMRPAASTVTSGSSADGGMALLPGELTPTTPQQQQRRHSSAVTTTNNNNLSNGQQQSHLQQQHQRNRQQRNSHKRTATMANNTVEMTNNGNSSSPHEMHSLDEPSPVDLYSGGTTIGMLDTSPMLPKAAHHNELSIFEKIALTNNFTPPAAAFNPFLYLQQHSGFFPATPIHANTVSLEEPPKQKQIRYDNVTKPDVEISEFPSLPDSATTLLTLEDCLNISQKLLRGFNSKNTQSYNEELFDKGISGEIVNREVRNCHSSSSTTSPSSRDSFTATLAGNSAAAIFQADEPRYFPPSLQWALLEGTDLERTVFSTFAGSNELIEKFDLSVFESLLEQTTCTTLLTPAQKEKVANIWRNLGLQSFEIMFAVHRMDTSVLTPQQVHLVEQIAPTKADCRRFALFEQSNSLGLLDKEEQFILELSKVDRLQNKLGVMALMGEFDSTVARLNQQLHNFSLASKLLFNSPEFHTILHLLLACINLISGDFTIQLVKGFRPSRIIEMCSFRFPNGNTLLEVLVQIMQKNFPDLFAFAGQSNVVIEDASKIEFSRILNELNFLERGQTLVEEELHMSESSTSDGKNTQLTNFLAHYSTECAQLKETMQSIKNQLLATMEFFGESQKDSDQWKFKPERFFAVITKFLTHIQHVADKSTSS